MSKCQGKTVSWGGGDRPRCAICGRIVTLKRNGDAVLHDYPKRPIHTTNLKRPKFLGKVKRK